MPKIIKISNRLRDGREVKTDADFRQWVYESLDDFSQEIGRDWTPIDIFPAMSRVMVDLPEGLREHMRRYCKPDGMCLHCGQPANQHHPVGPITVTTPDEDDAPQTGNASVTGPWRRPVAPSSSRTEPRREKRGSVPAETGSPRVRMHRRWGNGGLQARAASRQPDGAWRPPDRRVQPDHAGWRMSTRLGVPVAITSTEGILYAEMMAARPA